MSSFEVYKYVPDFVGYYIVSNHGTVKRIKRLYKKDNCVVVPYFENGKRFVRLTKENVTKDLNVDELVYKVFES